MMARHEFSSLIVYLDDFLIIEDTYKRCQDCLNILLQLLRELGFSISWSKVIGPTHKLLFWGIVIDTHVCTLSLCAEKLQFLSEKLLCFKNRKRANKRQLESLAGSNILT